MKRIAILIISNLIAAHLFGQQDQSKKDSFLLMEPVEVKATRAGENAPFTKTNLSKEEIQKLNSGQDLPFLLNQAPSVVINSDAGNGIGYTGIRIRGTDASRINVTLNGIPFNDAESQGTFFVDLPDFGSSVNSIQIQRGVGTSSNGAGAFGATINVSTNEVIEKPYTEINNSFGSYNSWKNTLKAGSGLIDGHFTADLRLSNISSDGYIDRAKSKLQSYYFSTAYLTKKSSLRFNSFSGKEKTYQAWYGVSESDLVNNRRVNYAGTEKPGEPYNNETDNYIQNHYQLFFNHQFNDQWKLSTALFYIKGKGYYEQYKAGQSYEAYGLTPPVFGADTAYSTDLIRQLWLDNDFYGNIFSLFHRSANNELTMGGGWNKYQGRHYGELIWAANGLNSPAARYYTHDALKTDLNFYIKDQVKIKKGWYGFVDLQYRGIKYNINGFENNPSLIVDNNYHFFNPKAGLSYFNNSGWSGFLSYSLGQKEPNRDDFEAGVSELPKPEKLNDIELNISKRNTTNRWDATFYYMGYKDQLVLTGKINNVGAYTRTNIPKSYRLGVELTGSTVITKWMNASANLSLSKNKVLSFTEYIDDYDAGGQKTNHYSETDIAYSPNIIAGVTIAFLPVKNFEIDLFSKYVGNQYLDNTQNENRKLNDYFVQDARVIYHPAKGVLKNTDFSVAAFNIFSRKYEPNGYTYSYYSGGELVTENYYFPMAPANVMASINIKL